jgi:hypothetical protein
MKEKMMTNPFDFLDITEEEAMDALDKADKYGKRDGRICICGHTLKSHSFVDARGVHVCNALKQACPCKTPRAVIESTNTRVFMRKTDGGGGLHALTKGISGAQKIGATVDWLIEIKCDRCATEGPIAPVPISADGRIQGRATGYDALLCRTCREQV